MSKQFSRPELKLTIILKQDSIISQTDYLIIYSISLLSGILENIRQIIQKIFSYESKNFIKNRIHHATFKLRLRFRSIFGVFLLFACETYLPKI